MSVFHSMQSVRTPWSDAVLSDLATLGSVATLAALAGTSALWMVWERRWHTLGYWLSALAFSQLLAFGMQVATHRAAPGSLASDAYVFPSNHVAAAVVVYEFLAFLVRRDSLTASTNGASSRCGYTVRIAWNIGFSPDNPRDCFSLALRSEYGHSASKDAYSNSCAITSRRASGLRESLHSMRTSFPVGETPSKSRNTLDVPKRSGSSRHSETNPSPCPNISGHRQQFRVCEKTFLKPALVMPIGARKCRSVRYGDRIAEVLAEARASAS